MTHLSAGERLASFEIAGPIASGGMGVVYRARQPSLERDVALKVIDPRLSGSARYRDRFLREARLAARVEHPHALPVYEAGEAKGVLYIAMRLVEGPTLAAVIADEGWLEPDRTVTLIRQIAGALDAIHERGLVHRDLKPDNVLIERRDGEEWAFLTDFGIARSAAEDASVTATGERIGTPDYSSPEQIEGRVVDARSDVYSLGCLAYACVAGAPPFRRDDEVATIYAQLHDPPPRLAEADPALPAGLDRAIARALSKQPGDRYGSPGEFAAAAQDALSESGSLRTQTVAPREAGAAPTKRIEPAAGRRKALPWGAGALAVAAAAVSLPLLLAGDGHGGPRVESTIGVGRAPLSVGVDAGSVFVASRGDGVIERFEIGDSANVESIPAGSAPSGLRAVNGSVWVTDPGDGTLLRFSLDGRRLAETPIAGRPSGLRVGEGAVWVASVAGDSVAKVDLTTSRVVATTRVGNAPSGVGVGEGAVWVANAGDGTVSRLAPGQGAVVGAPIEVGARPRGVATGEGAVWVANALDGTVSRIDPATVAVTDTIRVGARPAQVAVGEGAVWVANERDDTVSRIDPDSLEVTDTIAVGDGPRGIVTGGGAVWVTNTGGDSVTEIAP